MYLFNFSTILVSVNVDYFFFGPVRSRSGID